MQAYDMQHTLYSDGGSHIYNQRITAYGKLKLLAEEQRKTLSMLLMLD